jgi:hypothetical protein
LREGEELSHAAFRGPDDHVSYRHHLEEGGKGEIRGSRTEHRGERRKRKAGRQASRQETSK